MLRDARHSALKTRVNALNAGSSARGRGPSGRCSDRAGWAGIATARICWLHGCVGIASESGSNPFIVAKPPTALNWMILRKVGCALTAARMAAAVLGATVLK